MSQHPPFVISLWVFVTFVFQKTVQHGFTERD